MSCSFSKWLTAPVAALSLVFAAGLLVACSSDEQPPADLPAPDASASDADVAVPGPDAAAPPTARGLTLETAEDTPLAVQLGEDRALTYTIVDAPAHGTLSAVTADGSITYTPSADYHGEDTFRFRAANAAGQGAEAAVAIRITPVNDAPTLSSVVDQVVDEDGSTGALTFTVGDVDTAVDDWIVTATSSNPALVPDTSTNLLLGGSAAARTIEVIPLANASGSTTITLAVSDGTSTTTTTFTVEVAEVNDAPTVSVVADQQIAADTSTGDLAFAVGDTETAAESLTVTVTSSNTALVPNDASHLVLGGAGANRTLAVVPATRAHGSTILSITVSDGAASATSTFRLEVVGDACLYWMTATGSLWRVDVDGSDAIELATGVSGASAIATDPVTRSVYYASGSTIVRVDSEGANPVTVVANGGYPSGLAVDATNRKLYWSDFNGKRILRAELDGTAPTSIVSNLDSPSALAIDAPNGKLYVITYNNTKLVRANLDGSSLETLASNLGGQGVGLAIDAAHGALYYATRGNSIYRANLDGTNLTSVVINQNTVHGLALDPIAGRLYWAEWLGQTLRSASLDGTLLLTVNTPARNLGLAWMPAP